MITLKNISKEYKGIEILENINLSFRKNELVCILGPSGSGKTTLLNLIGALDSPSKGNIYLNGKNIKEINKDFYHNKIISFIFQNYNLIPNLNIYDNLVLPLRLTKKNIDIKKLTSNLKRFNLNNDLKENIKKLSGGEQQRVAIIRSFLSDTEIILADEPTGALDTYNSEKVMHFLKEISKEKLIIIVTHNKELAKKYANRIIKIKDGKIINDSNPYTEAIIKNFKETKTKLKLKEKLKISFTNLKNKKTRNILTCLAFSIGLFSLCLVLSIKNGFLKELNNLEKTSLYNYPLILAREYVKENTKIIDNKTYDNNTININSNNKIIKNEFNSNLYSKLKTIKNDGKAYVTYYKSVDNAFANISHVNPTNSFFKLVKGKLAQQDNEVMLLLDYNNSIDEAVYNYLNIDDLTYDSVLNKTYLVDNKEIIITGIIKSNNEYFSSLNGIIYNENLFDSNISYIYIYPTSYKNKINIKNILKSYYIMDNSEDALNITNSLVKGITLVLTLFSIISLIVSCIMISVMSYISIFERKKEIGILQSLGTNQKDIKSLFLTENKIISLISSILAIILTLLTSKILNSYITKFLDFNSLIDLNISIIVKIFSVSIFLSEISSLFSLRTLKKKNIIDNLKEL